MVESKKFPIGDLNRGAVFLTRGMPFIKVELEDDTAKMCSAVSLITGNVHYFEDEIEVLFSTGFDPYNGTAVSLDEL